MVIYAFLIAYDNVIILVTKMLLSFYPEDRTNTFNILSSNMFLHNRDTEEIIRRNDPFKED